MRALFATALMTVPALLALGCQPAQRHDTLTLLFDGVDDPVREQWQEPQPRCTHTSALDEPADERAWYGDDGCHEPHPSHLADARIRVVASSDAEPPSGPAPAARTETAPAPPRAAFAGRPAAAKSSFVAAPAAPVEPAAEVQPEPASEPAPVAERVAKAEPGKAEAPAPGVERAARAEPAPPPLPAPVVERAAPAEPAPPPLPARVARPAAKAEPPAPETVPRPQAPKPAVPDTARVARLSEPPETDTRTVVRGITLQVAAFTSADNAAGLKRQLEREFARVYVDEAPVAGKTWFRVRIGPVTTNAEARRAEARLRDLGYEPLRYGEAR